MVHGNGWEPRSLGRLVLAVRHVHDVAHADAAGVDGAVVHPEDGGVADEAPEAGGAVVDLGNLPDKKYRNSKVQQR